MINSNQYGVFNIASNQQISKYKFGKLIAKKFKYNQNLIIAKKFIYKNEEIKRPLNMTMNINKIQKIIPMPKLNNVIKNLVKEYDKSI